jgi:uncharacterized protein (TIGR04255 family)
MSDFSLQNPPLICVAARAQFMPLAKIADYIPEVQESLRLKGYPNFESSETKAFRIDNPAQAGVNITFESQPRWDFSNLERTILIRLDRESLTLFFADYHHFSQAQPFYSAILEMIAVKIPSLMLVGIQLRYINHIRLDVGENAADWVIPSVLGMPVVGGLTRQGSISETGFETPEGGSLIVRCAALANGLTLPPDILPLNIALKHSLHSDAPFVMLENVHACLMKDVPFSTENCLNQLSTLRANIVKIFRVTVTPKALESWK